MCGITGVFFLKNNKTYSLSSIKEMTSSLLIEGQILLDIGLRKDNNVYFGT